MIDSVAIQKFEDFPRDYVYENFFNKAKKQGYQPLDSNGYFSIIATGNQPHITQELPDIIGYSVMCCSYPGMGLPPYLRKSPKVESLLPILYLKGLSTNDFKSALSEFLGAGTMGLSPASIVK